MESVLGTVISVAVQTKVRAFTVLGRAAERDSLDQPMALYQSFERQLEVTGVLGFRADAYVLLKRALLLGLAWGSYMVDQSWTLLLCIVVQQKMNLCVSLTYI